MPASTKMDTLMTTTNFNCPFTKNTCNDIPDVTYKKTWHAGGTGYIDGVKPSDDVFQNTAVVKFVDEYDRSAISLKYTTSCPSQDDHEYVVTAFERYTDDHELWVFGGHYANQAATKVGVVKINWLESLINNGQENFSRWIGIENGNYDKPIYEECTITLAEPLKDISFLMDMYSNTIHAKDYL